MRWWVYKCNNTKHPKQGDWGDWDDFFRRRYRTWGSTEKVPSLAKLTPGDRIIAYQTNRNELVGLAHVNRLKKRGEYLDLYLEPVRLIRAKVKPLKDKDKRIAAIPAFKRGRIATIYDISDDAARRLIKAADATAQTRSNSSKTRAATANDDGEDEDRSAKLKVIEEAIGAGIRTTREHNVQVEKAAVAAVWDWFTREGWRVKDCQADHCGYDLLCTKGRRALHVEVKGVSGSKLQFPITCSEVKRARHDRRFLLSVVTNARTEDATIYDYRGDQFLRNFDLRPLAYMAVGTEPA